MKAIPLLAAIVPALVAGFDDTAPSSTVTAGQTATRTATTVHYVTVPGDSAAVCGASGCPLEASSISFSNATATSLETLRLTSTNTSTVTDVVTPPDATATIYHDTTSSSESSEISTDPFKITTETSMPITTVTVSPLPASDAVSEGATTTRTLEFGPLKTLGCYSEPIPLLQDNIDSHQTIESCQSACGNQGRHIMALTDGSACYCGDTVPSADKQVEEAKCNESCQGDKQHTCGGMGYWQFYSFDPHGELYNSEPVPDSKCSTSVVTVYVTATLDLSTTPTSNHYTTATAYPTGWGPPGSSGTNNYRPPHTTTSAIPAATESTISIVLSIPSVTPTLSAVTSSRTATPTIMSYHGSVGRVRPHGLFLLFARLLTLSTFNAQAQNVKGRFYPYPTPINGPLPHATSTPPVGRFVSETSALDVPMGTVLMTSTTTISTTTVPLLPPLNSGSIPPPVSALVSGPTVMTGSFSTRWVSSIESSPTMTGGSGTFAPWWSSVRNITVVQTVTHPGAELNSSSAPAAVPILNSTTSNAVNMTSVMTSTVSTTQTMTSIETVPMTMTTPAFSGPAMSDTPSSGASSTKYMLQAQQSVVLFHMLAGCAVFIYIFSFM